MVMKNLPTTVLTWAFARLPSPVIAVAAAALAAFFVTDVAIPDVLPFLDEAMLAFFFTGAMTELLRRRKARRTEAEVIEVDAVTDETADAA